MKRDELNYRGGMAKGDLINYIEKLYLEEDEIAYDFMLNLLQKILEYDKKQNGPNRFDFKKYVLTVRVSGVMQPVDALINCIIRREQDGYKGEAAEVIYNLLDRIYLYGEANLKNVKDALMNLLFDVIPNFSKEEAAAFINDDLLSESGLEYKKAFWDKHKE